MQTTPLYKEAKRLYDEGCAIHWLHPKSKRPLESGWTTGPRKEWKDLKESYNSKLNVGVRLGEASRFKDGYLAVVDIDVKSDDSKHRDEALAAAKKVVKGMKCPTVSSGRGNGSRHYYCRTEKPFKTWNPAQSKEIIKVKMPSKNPSKKELEQLTKEEIADGIRLAHAWEVSLYSDGRQVVLPPSIHPDTNKEYKWVIPFDGIESLPMIYFDERPESGSREGSEGGFESSGRDYTGKESNDVSDFVVENVDLEWLEISTKMKMAIKHGEGVTDRSGFLLPACTALVSAGLDKNEVLSVLTDKTNYLGGCAYEHAQTTNRKRAALWLWKYTLKRVTEERSAELAFAGAIIEPLKILGDDDSVKQAKALEQEHWTYYLEQTDKGKYRNSLQNCNLILTKSCSQENFVGRNEFAINDYYLCDTPWRSFKGEAIKDIDIVRIKEYCNINFNIEFNDHVINQVLLQVADANRYHPVRNWLRSLKWDGVERIDNWLTDFAGAIGPSPYLPDVSRKLLVAMVARVMNPGCKFDQIVILEGNQGTGKSTLLRKLTSDAWFSDAPMIIGDKDSVLIMQSKWMVEVGELSSMRKADIDAFKVFATQMTDRMRSPYGKKVEDYPRQSVLVGTTNNDDYLRDLTGNRRFWSVKTEGKIDWKGLEKVRDQLFAEAVVYFDMDEPLYLDNPESEAQANNESGKRLEEDVWLPLVRDIVSFETFNIDKFELRDVANKMDSVGAHKLSVGDGHRIGRCLRLLGFEKFREGGSGRKKWRALTFVKDKPLDEPDVTLEGSPKIFKDFEDFY